MDHISVRDNWLLCGVSTGGHRMLHPGIIEAFGEVITGVSATRLLAVLGSVHGHLGLDHQVLQFHCLNQVGVPDLASVAESNVGQLERVLVESLAANFEVILSAEHSGILLHGLLHFGANLGRWLSSLRVSQLVKLGQRLLTGISRQIGLGLAWLYFLGNGLSGASAKHNQIEQRVRAQPVGSVHR